MPKTKSQTERIQECIDIKKKLSPYLKDKDAKYNKKIIDIMNDYIKNGSTLHEYILIPSNALATHWCAGIPSETTLVYPGNIATA